MGWRLTWSDVIMRAGNPAASSKYSLGMETKSLVSTGGVALVDSTETTKLVPDL